MDGSIPHSTTASGAFNTNAIVYDNSPWRPGRDVEPERGEDERKLKNLATRIMSNGVEVLVKDRSAEEKQEQTRYSDVKTIQPSAVSNSFVNNNPKIDKRIDDDHNHFDLIEPSEMSHTSCSTSCTCSHIQTESLKTKYTNVKSKSTKYSGTKIDVPPTHLSSYDHTKYHPYEYETSSHGPPTDKVVEKYTQVTDYSDENDSNSLDMSDLLTNEQAPEPPKTKSTTSKPPEKSKPDKPQKVNKNKFVVAELIKLGSLGIKGLSQLAPVIEKMTGGFMRRQETNRTTSTTTTVKPINKVVGYSANKRVDNEVESKHNNFPIYIPVDEMEMAESQIGYTNVTLQQNIAWAADHKNSKVNLMKSKIVHESPLVNGGIPISPGEIITTNSDVIVGKPAVGGPVSLVGTGMKLQNQAQAPDNAVAHSDMYSIKEKPLNDYPMVGTKIDDSYDLRPPELPKPNAMVTKNAIRPHGAHFSPPNIHIPLRNSGNLYKSSEHSGQISYSKDKSPNLVYHGRPSILDYKPSFTNSVKKPFENKSTNKENDQQEIPDNNPSSSEIVSTHIMTDGQGTDFEIVGAMNKPLLVDIQPSKVANVLIPHGSSTALVFAGSAEPHKTGDYVDDPLPYPEPGYFGSFSIDAPHMTNVHNVASYGKECQPDCKASRNERCQRIDSVMKCVCRPGFARMFPDRPCKPTYTYSVRLGLGSRDNKVLKFHKSLSDNSTKEYESLSLATHEGINRMIMQSDLRDVYHGVHITGFHPIEMRTKDGAYQGVINDFYVQLSDNAHESRLKEVIEKYLRNNNYSLGGTEVYASEEFIESLNVSDFDECTSTQFNDCSEHARCFNLRGTYTCSCLEGFADLSVNTLYPGRICSSDAIGCAGCNYHGTCFDRENAMICECFKWYAGRTCQVNLKAVLITVTVVGALVIIVVTIWASKRCCSQKNPTNQTFVIGCMQGMPSLHQGNVPSKQRADRRALIAERNETAETCSVQNASLPYAPSKSRSRSHSKQAPEPPPHSPPPPPALMIPRARLHPLHDSRDNLSRRKSSEVCNEAKLISYLESGATNTQEMRRKHSIESSYSVNKERANKQGALVSAGYKVSTTIRPDENSIKCERDDTSSINKNDLEAELSRFDTLRKSYSQEDMSEWTDAERRIGELTLSEARSVGGTLPASTGRAASSTRLTHQEANTMAERDLGSTFLLPHVHLYKPDLTSDVSEFDSL
ncbi:hypothetical protein KGM_208594 [Danaus plexippus plexippus]|uniref:63 kDa sperm flagellar membrane protein n=1 Tax=Danaus plexippus plexippus TaxID=278856 RepID=A0A212FFN0_DANPL|nr:hypothetical protein KGM_208594 [Danaus plexippus plexippus]